LLQRLLACGLTRRRLDRYLDGDPVGHLSLETRRAVARHLDECASCAELARQLRLLTKALRLLGASTGPDPMSLARLNALLVSIEAKS
jgi:anti-sigma factor RsiW